MLKRILVPLDGSPLAQQALIQVPYAARRTRSEVILLGVSEDDSDPSDETYSTYLARHAEHLRHLVSGTDVTVRTDLVRGRAADTIVTYALQKGVGLVFMTSHGRSGLGQWPLGGTVEQAVRSMPVPLLILRAREHLTSAHQASIFERVLAPLDGSRHGESALPYISELRRSLGSELVLLRVVEDGSCLQTSAGVDIVGLPEQQITLARTAAGVYLKSLATKMAGAERTKSEVRIGEPFQQIMLSAADNRCALIAMSTHGQSAREQLPFGTITYKVLYGGDQAVLLVRSFAVARDKKRPLP